MVRIDTDMGPILAEYRESLKSVRVVIDRLTNDLNATDTMIHHDLVILRAMERDVAWIIQYLKDKVSPHEGRYRRCIPVDPHKVLIWFERAATPTSIDGIEDNTWMKDAIRSLTDRERESLMLVIVEGISWNKAADLMGITRSSLQNYIRRAKAKIIKYRDRLDGEL